MSMKFLNKIVSDNFVDVDTKSDESSQKPIANSTAYEIVKRLENPFVTEASYIVRTTANGRKVVDVTFDKPFNNIPVVVISPCGNGFGTSYDNQNYCVIQANSITETGFSVILYKYSSSKMQLGFSWIAVEQ